MKSGDFGRRYLEVAQDLHDLEESLMRVGMSGNDNFRRLCMDFIKHGSVTLDDIRKED